MPVILARSSQQAAGYRPEGGVERCGFCRFFVSQGTCNRILGPVSPRGWCRYFSRMVYLRLDAGADDDFLGGPAGVTQDLNFMSGTMPSGVTFTRASTATYFDSTSTMRTVAANIPRFDYNQATHALNGMLIEEARTNVLLNSATLGTQSVAVTAQAYTLSFYGTGTITKSGTATGALVGTGAFPQRVSQTFTPTAGTLTLTVTGTVQSAQLEAGAFPTSYIPTTGAAATRAQDSASMPAASWIGSPASTSSLAAEFMSVVPATAGNWQVIVSLDDGTTNNRAQILRATGTADIYTVANVYNPILGTMTTGAVTKAALAFTNGLQQSALNGVATGGASASGMPVGMTTLNIGVQYSAGFPLNGWVRRFRYWSRVLSTTELQQVTT